MTSLRFVYFILPAYLEMACFQGRERAWCRWPIPRGSFGRGFPRAASKYGPPTIIADCRQGSNTGGPGLASGSAVSLTPSLEPRMYL